jgi:hypothetical protein
LLKVGNEYVWIWVAIKPIDKLILDIHISFERTILLIAERKISKSLDKEIWQASSSFDRWRDMVPTSL